MKLNMTTIILQVNLHSGWFEGAHLFVPSTNNAFEATNRVIEDQKTFPNSFIFLQMILIRLLILNISWGEEKEEERI
ncbi:hypothetical protein BpHYR1_049085 [Brachionus plicatilis]|uniref:Uncharacterized protein n=1 Tax=Brachionus plicatilis TaxID=10195 RepID=A0A3M7T9A4_BRAPC|nr:hypothetical protein BpHYR1_049085 [Brachionus plicatilis]